MNALITTDSLQYNSFKGWDTYLFREHWNNKILFKWLIKDYRVKWVVGYDKGKVLFTQIYNGKNMGQKNDIIKMVIGSW